jgi:hypothetical protein
LKDLPATWKKGMRPLNTLLGFDEMVSRHKAGEDPFDLAIEKWVRIRDFLVRKKDPARYQEAFQCGSTKTLFCLDYKNYCTLCPMEFICFDSQSLYYQIMRCLQVYSIAGTFLPLEPLVELINTYIRDLNQYRDDWVKRSH